jgi:hypothetical protein
LLSLKGRSSKEENQLFSIFLKLCEINDQKLGFIHKFNFLLLKGSLLKEAFQNYPLENLTYDLFASFKKRLFSDFLIPTNIQSDLETVPFIKSVSKSLKFCI